MDRMFRLLRADEIECRVSTINENGLTLLLYKDARVDQNILDETVGPGRWQRSHELINGNLFCNVGIRFERETGFSEWVWKQDVGVESYTEKEKGQASDAFKRACFNWGIGRELYTAPFIWIRANQYNATSKNGKPTTYDRFHVGSIEYKNGEISYLTIVNSSTNKKGIVFTFGKQENPDEKISEKQVISIRMVCKKNGMPEDRVFMRYGKNSIEEMTLSDWEDFKKTGDKMLQDWKAESA